MNVKKLGFLSGFLLILIGIIVIILSYFIEIILEVFKHFRSFRKNDISHQY